MVASTSTYPTCASCTPAVRHTPPTDDEDDPNVVQLNKCAPAYLCLQNCLIRTDRNWRECQPEVKALRACYESQQAAHVDSQTAQRESLAK